MKKLTKKSFLKQQKLDDTTQCTLWMCLKKEGREYFIDMSTIFSGAKAIQGANLARNFDFSKFRIKQYYIEQPAIFIL